MRQEGLQTSGERHCLPARLPGHTSSDVSASSLLCVQVLLEEEDIWEGAALIALPAAASSGRPPCPALRRLQPRAGRAFPEDLDTAADAWLRAAVQAPLASGGRGAVAGWPLATAGSQRSSGSVQGDASLPQNHFSPPLSIAALFF